MYRYDVALWRWWPAVFPDGFALVDALNAFAAVEWLMRSCGLHWVAYASVRALDGSVVYRCYGLRLLPEVMCELTAEELAVFG